MPSSNPFLQGKKLISSAKPKPINKPEAEDDDYWFGKALMVNGVLFLNSEVNDDNILPLCQSILEYSLLAPECRPDHITLFINSPGGYMSSAYQLIDSIKGSTIPIVTIGTGQVASAGVMILMAGAKGHRMVTETCSIMSHQYSTGIGGKEHEVIAANKELSLDTARMLRHYQLCTKKSEKYIRKHLLTHSDCYLTPEEAVTHGIADNILKVY